MPAKGGTGFDFVFRLFPEAGPCNPILLSNISSSYFKLFTDVNTKPGPKTDGDDFFCSALM
jgi:hypothetical protein